MVETPEARGKRAVRANVSRLLSDDRGGGETDVVDDTPAENAASEKQLSAFGHIILFPLPIRPNTGGGSHARNQAEFAIPSRN